MRIFVLILLKSSKFHVLVYLHTMSEDKPVVTLFLETRVPCDQNFQYALGLLPRGLFMGNTHFNLIWH